MADKMNCIIVSGAPCYSKDYVLKNINDNSYIIAADKGYSILCELGIKPDLIVADFDSSEKPLSDVECEIFPIEKNATDTFNALKIAVEKGFTNIRILNALGGRIDHTYSNILCLSYAKEHNVYCEICDENQRVSLITECKTFKKDYQWFSLFAFLENCKGVRIHGAHYTQKFTGCESLEIRLNDQFGQSNYIEGDECTVTVEKGTLLLIESNDF